MTIWLHYKHRGDYDAEYRHRKDYDAEYRHRGDYDAEYEHREDYDAEYEHRVDRDGYDTGYRYSIRTSGLLPGNGHTRTPMNGEENLLEKNTSTLKMDTGETTKVHKTNVYIYPYIVKSVIPQIK